MGEYVRFIMAHLDRHDLRARVQWLANELHDARNDVKRLQAENDHLRSLLS